MYVCMYVLYVHVNVCEASYHEEEKRDGHGYRTGRREIQSERKMSRMERGEEE